MRRRSFLVRGLAVPMVLSPKFLLALAGETYTSPEAAGAIFALQGEYVGVIDSWDGSWGAQLIATSENDLQVHLLAGGLPGDGFKGREPTKKCSAKVDGNKATGSGDGFSIETDGTDLKVIDAGGTKVGTLIKIRRESKTLGMEPPKGAKVLFDGSNVEQFQNGKLSEDGHLGVGCTSRDAFQDHRLHLEFRTPFQPSDSDQKRGNSGVYVQGRYELQVLDSFGLKGEDNECGGIYQIAQPRLNMCYPPLSWQTYDIEFRAPKFETDGKKSSNARITIRHNGVLIHDDLELPRGTPGGVSDERPEPGPLYLQDHGNPVVFRNIWVVAAEPEELRNRAKAKAFLIE